MVSNIHKTDDQLAFVLKRWSDGITDLLELADELLPLDQVRSELTIFNIQQMQTRLQESAMWFESALKHHNVLQR